MLNEFWATASTTYKRVVFAAMGLLGLGLVLNIVGNIAGYRELAITALFVIGAGLVLHLLGIGIRAREVSRRLRK
ncbi:DUF3188 domain-containing protein [Pseudarthrobacter sp. PS3-L1]|uniref:DUF3188 domain-containing protein n=1 Tax=Pseudarthrobacter sp. PS3-L1 TaxID=3046207 RepID=UPI0024B9C548|nr:DUF3188 domain-containing protein [Pseudarthrobacter sp. PS3-L1]MDJ0321235.1 DUF3188 domain-containing protein [Pseudarthrobacter sp. PS3-L1]